MNLKALNKIELDLRIKSLVKKEREVLYDILLTIKEIDTRKTYLDFGYSNLFSYLTDGVGYSAGSAQRRIEAARLIKDIPDLAQKIQTGEITLNQVSLVQKASRDVFKTTSKKVTSAEKQELLAVISNTDYKKSQKEVANYFDLPILEATKQTVQADESIRLEITLTKSLHRKIQEAQSLLSHALGDNDLVNYLEYVTDKVIKQKTSVRKFKLQAQQTTPTPAEAETGTESKTESESEIHAMAPSISLAKSTSKWNESLRQDFSAREKKIARNHQACCQYVDPQTKKQCSSKWYLQVDHVQPKWAQGDASPKNSQILCSAHNRHKYRQELGVELKS